MIRYTYLLIDLMSLLMPLVFSFHHKIRLYKQWHALLPAILLVAAAYSVWDSIFTYLGIWGFNPAYLTGICIGNLPLEEILFFICIPYSCVFTFECISPVISASFLQRYIELINLCFVGVLITLTVVFRVKPYTASAFTLLSALLLTGMFLKITWLAKFYLVYAVLLIPFLVVNGLLTGTGLSSPVVWYSTAGITGLRILTIPVEDVFYGMGLILTNVWAYVTIRSRQQQKRVL